MAQRHKKLMTRVAQSTIEFTFAMILVLLLIFGLIRIFRWVGMDLSDRRIVHERVLEDVSLSPEAQIAPDFYRPRKMGAVFNGFNFAK